MGALYVPESAAPIFARLAKLDAGARDTLIELLAASKAHSVAELSAEIESALGWPGEDARTLLRHVLGLTMAALVKAIDVEDIARSVRDSHALDSEELTDDQRDALDQALTGMTSTVSVQQIAKTIDLGQERDRHFASARVITDIRPIFAALDDGPRSALVMHELRLGYFDKRSNYSTYSVSLNEGDLRQLKAAVDRALSKGALLRSWLDEHNMDNLSDGLEDES